MPDNKIALVTGARRSGKPSQQRWLDPARVVITYNTSADEAAITVAEINRSGGQASALQCDQRDLAAIDRLFDRLRREVDRLDILVNNAAIMEPKPALEITSDDWSRVMETNLRGPFFMAQRAAQWMLTTGGGVIVNIADLSALHPWPSYLAHTISKSGLLS
jgi:NAD(P)-dependent dehydrogenase (short-subunit alcohol dehydrogenase family)